uniref:Uncharacterized protein n=1 Tax=Panagrolaimus sp. ES5 TaxID=591445 RepID=A0AC34GJ86_9BILA
MFMPPSMPIQTLTPKVATPNTPQQQLFTPTPTPTTPQTILITPTTPTIHLPKRRAASPEIIVDDRPIDNIPEKKTKSSDKVLPEQYTTNTDSFFPTLSLQSSTENSSSSTLPSYLQTSTSSISTLSSIDNTVKTTASSSISLPSTAPSTILSNNSEKSADSDAARFIKSINDRLSLSHPQHYQNQNPPTSESLMEAEETHIIITARPRVPDSAERDSTYTTDDDSD